MQLARLLRAVFFVFVWCGGNSSNHAPATSARRRRLTGVVVVWPDGDEKGRRRRRCPSPCLKNDDGESSTHRGELAVTADRINVVNPKLLPASLAVNRTKLLGLRGDYKPYITQLATEELLMVHRCEAILSSPPQVMNGYQDCSEDHLVLWLGTATGDSWNRTQHVAAVAAPHDASADIVGGEFSVQTLADGTVFLHSGGCQYYRSTDHARSFTASNSSWNCTLCSGTWCGGGGSSYNVIEVQRGDATSVMPPGLYFFAHIHVYRSIDSGVSFQLHVSASVLSNGQWDMRGGDSFFEQTGTPFLTKAGVLVNVPRVGVRSDWDETDGSQLWASTNGGRDWSCRTNAAGNFCANNNFNFSCMNNVSYSCSSSHSGDRRSFGGPGDMYPHMLRLHDDRTLLTWTKRCNRATDFILRSINQPANAPCRDDGHGTGLRALLTDELALEWDWQSDYMILSEQSDLYSDISGSGCECGYGNTIQLRGSDTLVTVYSYANATEINASIATDHGTGLHRGFASHIGVMRWRLPPLKSDDKHATAPTVTKSTTAVDNHRLHVDGKPYFLIGTFVHGLDASDWKYLQESSFNVVMTYTNGLPLPSGISFDRSTFDQTQSFLDAAMRHNIGVILSLKDYYDCCHLGAHPQPGCCHSGANAGHNNSWYNSLVSDIVHRFKEHPALRGWYLNDEYHPDLVPLLEARFAQVSRLDTAHISYSVTNLANSHNNLKQFENTSHLMGVDPYPWHNCSTTINLTLEANNAMALADAIKSNIHRASTNLAQAFDWSHHAKCASGFAALCNSSFPSDAALRAMTLLHPVLGSTSGVMMYSYLGLYGWPQDQLPAKVKSGTKLSAIEVQRRKALVALVTAELAELARDVFVPLSNRTSVCNGQHSSVCGENIFASRFVGDGKRAVVIVVNAQNVARTVGSSLCGAALDLEPWAVRRCDHKLL